MLGIILFKSYHLKNLFLEITVSYILLPILVIKAGLLPERCLLAIDTVGSLHYLAMDMID